VFGLWTVAEIGAQTPVAVSGQAQEAVTSVVAPCTSTAPAREDTGKKPDEQDWLEFGALSKYHEADLALGAPQTGENRVVFIGDSITEGWHFTGAEDSFAGKPYVNRGINGQTTPQMLLRFRQDVLALQPKVVVILAGTNDIAGNTGPMTLEQTEDNLASMAELAAANHVHVVLCSILPAFDYPWKRGMEPANKILAINTWMKRYAAQKGFVYVDFHTAMKDSRNGLPETLSKDGVHPTAAGYAVMAPLVEGEISQVLAR
jgi:lysophospholipase L1-like esterase